MSNARINWTTEDFKRSIVGGLARELVTAWADSFDIRAVTAYKRRAAAKYEGLVYATHAALLLIEAHTGGSKFAVEDDVTTTLIEMGDRPDFNTAAGSERSQWTEAAVAAIVAKWLD